MYSPLFNVGGEGETGNKIIAYYHFYPISHNVEEKKVENDGPRTWASEKKKKKKRF